MLFLVGYQIGSDIAERHKRDMQRTSSILKMEEYSDNKDAINRFRSAGV